MKKLSAIILIIFALSLLSSCGAQTADDFDASIAALDYTASPMYVKIDSLSGLLDTAKPNLILRGKVASRGEPAIIDPSGTYDNSYLTSSEPSEQKQRCAAAYLSTPYIIEVGEVLLGSADGEIEIDAPYGILDGYYRRDGLHPILKVGQEYLFFLRTDYMYGDQVYYLAFAPASALELYADGSFGGEYADYIDGIFGEYDNSASRLLADLGRLILENDYDLTMDSFGKAE